MSKRTFLRSFAKIGQAHESAKVADTSINTIYRWKDEDPEFAAEWQRIMDSRADKLEQTLLQRALGWDEPIFDRNGNEIGSKHKYDTVAGIFWLKGHRPQKYKERFEGNVNLSVADALALRRPERRDATLGRS